MSQLLEEVRTRAVKKVRMVIWQVTLWMGNIFIFENFINSYLSLYFIKRKLHRMQNQQIITLMDRSRVKRSLKRMAYQIAEDNRNNKEMLLIGIDERGYILAGELSGILSGIYDEEIPLVHWSREDGLAKEEIKNDPGNCYVLVIDDVIFSGRTMFKALTGISGKVDLEEIHTAVLVDRGHRKFPVQSQFTGMELATKFKEHVSVKTGEGQITEVVLEMNGQPRK